MLENINWILPEVFLAITATVLLGYGTILSGSLERSNVDITEELVNLITAQRNFQANAKTIETNKKSTK